MANPAMAMVTASAMPSMARPENRNPLAPSMSGINVCSDMETAFSCSEI